MEIMRDLQELIDNNMENFTDKDYLKLCNLSMEIYNSTEIIYKLYIFKKLC